MIKKVITLLSTLLVMFVVNAIFPDHSGRFYGIIEIGGLITIIALLLSFTIMPIGNFVHEIRLSGHTKRNDILTQKKRHDELTGKTKEDQHGE